MIKPSTWPIVIEINVGFIACKKIAKKSPTHVGDHAWNYWALGFLRIKIEQYSAGLSSKSKMDLIKWVMVDLH